MLETKRRLRVLDFDIECRPLSYLGSDFTTGEVTAIASCWVGAPETMQVSLLGEDDSVTMLNSFLARYNAADLVTGHYIRNFDLPTINGALMDFGLPGLTPKLTSCTKNDLVRRMGISASQENLSAMFDLPMDKTHMSQIDWRVANRLTPEGISRTKKRVTTDVYQHMLLRAKLLQLGLLKGPKVWKP